MGTDFSFKSNDSDLGENVKKAGEMPRCVELLLSKHRECRARGTVPGVVADAPGTLENPRPPGHQLGLRFDERPCLEGIRWRVIGQSTWCPPPASVRVHRLAQIHTLSTWTPLILHVSMK